MKRISVLFLALCLCLCGCGKGQDPEVTVFAAASLQEALTEIGDLYLAERPGVRLVFSFDSSGTLQTQIAEGAPCDVFVSAGQEQMDALEEAGLLVSGSRFDLLENQVVLAVPEGNPAGLRDFDGLRDALEAGTVLLALGGGGVPAGLYARRILDWYGLEEEALASRGLLTYGSNVREVAAQVSEASVDCGIIYATDAAAGLETVAAASPEMCGQILYPAAALGEAGLDFLDFLRTDPADQVLASYGFTPLS